MTYFKLSFLIFVSCACSSTEIQLTEIDPFIAELIADLDELQVESITELKTEENQIFVPMHIRMVGQNRFIVVEGQRSALHLLTTEGEVLHTAGNLGHGPGEFVGINQLEVSYSNQLYVTDLSLQRISRFKLVNDRIEFIDAIPFPPQPDQLSLRTIQVSDSGNYGVLMSPRPNRTFQLHKLDESFKSIGQIFEMDGHFPDIHFSNSQLTNAKWSFDSNSNTFNFVYLDSIAIHTVNLLTKSSDRHIVHEPHQNRVANSMNHEHIAQVFRLAQDPAYEPDPSLRLPHVFNALTQGDVVIINLIYYGGSNTILLHYNRTTKKTNYIKAPPGFFLESFANDFIIGKWVRPELPNKVLMLKIEGSK